MTAIERPHQTLGRRTVLASAIALIALSAAAGAHAQPELVSLTVVDRDTGREMPVWRHDGRLFVAGEQGRRYALRVVNHSDGRVLVVMSVDGVNIISGETVGYDGRGYILSPHESYDVTGWRKSEWEVAGFAFTALPNSYAAETGRPADVGVIGLAAFRERVAPPITPLAAAPAPPSAAAPSDTVVTGGRVQRRNYSTNAPPPPAPPPAIAPPPPLPIPPVERPIAPAPDQYAGLARAPREEKLGTAHGALEQSVSHVRPFQRATPYPQSVLQIEYDSWTNLAARGVIPPSAYQDRAPRPFPESSGRQGYVPDPPVRR